MTSTTLKMIALICMVIDHIGAFIPNMPEWFRWIGRVSGPIFIFCMVWGLAYTKSRTAYLKRLYIASLVMAVGNILLEQLRYGNYYVSPQNNIFSTLFIIAVTIMLIEEVKHDRERGIKYLRNFGIWQLGTTILSLILIDFLDMMSWVNPYTGRGTLAAIWGNAMFCEGGIFFVAFGVGLYFVKSSKKYLTLYYIGFWIIYSLCFAMGLAPRVVSRLQYWGYDILSDIVRVGGMLVGIDTIWGWEINYSWMLIGALPIILLYNNKKGRGFKYFFYVFYPVHIWVLFLIGNWMTVNL